MGRCIVTFAKQCSAELGCLHERVGLHAWGGCMRGRVHLLASEAHRATVVCGTPYHGITPSSAGTPAVAVVGQL